MRKILLFYLIFQLVVAPAYAATDFVNSLKTSGGDYSNISLWEAYTDDIDFSQTNKVVTGVTVTSGSFPSSGTAIDDGSGNSGTVRATANADDEAMICNVTGTLVADGLTEYCNGGDCITFTGQDDLGAVWLEIFGTGWDVSQAFAGASSTSATNHRGLIGNSFTATGTPHFTLTSGSNYVLSIGEQYFVVRNISAQNTNASASNTSTIYVYVNNVLIDGCSVKDSANSDTGVANGITSSTTDGVLFYRSIVEGCDGDGFTVSAGSGETTSAICCTAKGNGGYGFTGSSTGTVFVWSCYGKDNTGGDFEEANWDSTYAEFNSSKDNTSDLGGAATNYGNGIDLNLDADGLAQDTTNMSGASYGRNP
jgi:hypothetical protein